MQSSFDQALKLTLREEGGWADSPRDNGGATMKGITLATFAAWCLKHDRPKPEKSSLRNISDADVSDIYRYQYWNAVKGDELPAGLDYAVFDCAVNSGSSQAVKMLQRAIGVTEDGKVGLKTMDAIDKADRRTLINAYCDRRLAFLKALGGPNGWSKWGKGWGSRVSRVRSAALGWNGVHVTDHAPVISAPKADPRDTAVLSTKRGQAAGGTILAAVGTGVAGSADKLLDRASDGGTYVWVFVVGFAVLTVIGSLVTWYIVRKKMNDEGSV